MARENLDWPALAAQIGYSVQSARIGTLRKVPPSLPMFKALQVFGSVEGEPAPEVASAPATFRGASAGNGADTGVAGHAAG